MLVYLTSEAIDGLFAFIAALPPASECAFTFGGTRGTDEAGKPSLATLAAAAGEPWQSTLELDDVVAVLARAGLPRPVLLSRSQIAAWLGERADGLEAPKRNRIASVVVG